MIPSEARSIRISIIIPVYNPGVYLKTCAYSILHQTCLQDLDILFVDDGSTDGSAAYLDTIADGKNCKVIHQSNGGVQSARRAGIVAASGDYITFLDADDFVALNTYEECIKAIKKYALDLCVFRYSECYSDKKEPEILNVHDLQYTVLEHQDMRDSYMAGANFGGFLWNKLWKKEIIRKIDFRDDFQITEDAVYVWDSLKYVQRAVILEAPFHSYRIIMSSMTRKNSVEKYMAAAASWDYLTEEAERLESPSREGIAANKIAWNLAAAKAIVKSLKENAENKQIIEKRMEEVRPYKRSTPLHTRILYDCLRISWRLFSVATFAVRKAREIQIALLNR